MKGRQLFAQRRPFAILHRFGADDDGTFPCRRGAVSCLPAARGSQERWAPRGDADVTGIWPPPSLIGRSANRNNPI
jgi:hypothetical protein